MLGDIPKLASPDTYGQKRPGGCKDFCVCELYVAHQEARWQAERELAWQTFIANARRIIEAPLAQREILLAIYGVEATRRFGPRMGTDMMKSMASWVRLKGVH